MEMPKNRKSAQSNAKHLLFEIQNKLGTLMPWMTSVANKVRKHSRNGNAKKCKSTQRLGTMVSKKQQVNAVNDSTITSSVS